MMFSEESRQEVTNEEMLNEQAQPTFTLEAVDGLPTIELRVRADGTVEYRYCAESGSNLHRDSGWRVMSETARRNHISVGGKIGEWLKSLE